MSVICADPREAVKAKNVDPFTAAQHACSLCSRQATSFSCSLGAAMQIAMIPLLSELEDKPFEERPVLYACESPVSDSAHSVVWGTCFVRGNARAGRRRIILCINATDSVNYLLFALSMLSLDV